MTQQGAVRARATWFSQLDFRTKLVLMLLVLAATVLWESVALSALLALVVFLLSWFAGLDRTFVRRILAVSLPFYAFIILMQAWFGAPLVSLRMEVAEDALTPLLTLPPHWPVIGGARMTIEGTLYGISVACKTLTLSLLLPLVVLSSDTNAVVASLIKLGVPYKLAFIFSATLRFFPLLMDESRAIIEAQQLRGIDIASMGPLRKLSTYARIAVPLILGAYTRSQYLEMVLQAKGFPGVKQRTYLYNAQLQRMDIAMMLILLLLFILLFVAYVVWGIGKFGGLI